MGGLTALRKPDNRAAVLVALLCVLLNLHRSVAFNPGTLSCENEARLVAKLLQPSFSTHPAPIKYVQVA